MRRRELEIKVGEIVLLEKYWLSSSRQKRVAKFDPKFDGPYEVLEVRNNNLVTDVEGVRTTVNLDQVTVYKFREGDKSAVLKCHKGRRKCLDHTSLIVLVIQRL